MKKFLDFLKSSAAWVAYISLAVAILGDVSKCLSAIAKDIEDFNDKPSKSK